MKYANVHDTLLAHHSFASHLPQRLDHVASCYTDSRPWKRLFKGGDEDEKGTTPDKLDGETLCKYNAADAQLTMLSWIRMQGDLKRESSVYEHDRSLAAVCREMIRVGVQVDVARKHALSKELEEKCQRLALELRAMTGRSNFNPGAPQQVADYLFKQAGIRFLKLTKKGKPAADASVLEGLRMSSNAERARFANALIEWRVADKVRGTYVDAIGGPNPKTSIHLTTDGRAHYNWKPFGTVSGRLSCRLQSAPRYNAAAPEERVRELYVASPGHELVYYDVAQAEMRLAAYLSNDSIFIAACAGDVHANNAKAVFPQAAHLLDDEAAKKDPNRGKKYRDIAKNLGFAISYCAEAEKVFQTLRSKGFDVNYQSVQLILSKLHAAYRVYYRWVEENLSHVKQKGFMRSPFLGRIRWLGWYPKITDVANYPIQSGLADIVNKRTIALAQHPILTGRLVAQVHDACIYDVPKGEVNGAKEIIANEWAKSIDTPGGELTFPIDLKCGHKWSDL
jgi:DNA polymerase I-like protein with 3'-5' exonuclease and polymerase domains